MVAVVIDPIVCHTWAGWFLFECYGIIPCASVVLSLGLAAGLRQMTARRLAR